MKAGSRPILRPTSGFGGIYWPGNNLTGPWDPAWPPISCWGMLDICWMGFIVPGGRGCWIMWGRPKEC